VQLVLFEQGQAQVELSPPLDRCKKASDDKRYYSAEACMLSQVRAALRRGRRIMLGIAVSYVALAQMAEERDPARRRH
jgi:hypothetical protein